MGLSAEEMMDTKLIAQRAGIRLGVDLSSQKRLGQVRICSQVATTTNRGSK